jgi:hypothetical protein
MNAAASHRRLELGAALRRILADRIRQAAPTLPRVNYRPTIEIHARDVAAAARLAPSFVMKFGRRAVRDRELGIWIADVEYAVRYVRGKWRCRPIEVPLLIPSFDTARIQARVD